MKVCCAAIVIEGHKHSCTLVADGHRWHQCFCRHEWTDMTPGAYELIK